ncbi:Ribonuclease P/MRP protein subunit POP5 [Porphyridium purpureum]|uniref:Ribonuclease P/MRP protein subunit POP5 n=1 Tax=Porphyridium purpureum TaxID=35688 RepID=A0A5J4YUT8_PORPP|nr:Ribonuclease P/MRP protein subunit POP5 [Porphyridium purpureum]|eukprot:POR9195..scf227_4
MVRFKNRYLLVRVDVGTSGVNSTPALRLGDEAAQVRAVSKLTSKQLFFVIKNTVQEQFGDVGAALVGGSGALAVKYWSPELRVAIVRAPRALVHKVWAACSLITCVRETGCSSARLAVLHVGGTIRSTQKELLVLVRKQFVNSHIHKVSKPLSSHKLPKRSAVSSSSTVARSEAVSATHEESRLARIEKEIMSLDE